MDEISLSTLSGILLFLIVLSACFSASETAMLSMNRYRLRHLAKIKHPAALRASRLLERPDRLIGLILLGNNFVNILASSIATIIALRLIGEAGIAIASGLLTLIILIFAEVAPKTLAALHPERIAFPASFVLGPLLKVLYPVVWVINAMANGLLRLLGVSPSATASHSLDTEELRTVLKEAGGLIPHRHQRMLLNILDLENVTVEDVMVARNEIVGIDLNDEWDDIVSVLTNTQFSRLPVYTDSIDHIVGMLHVRNILTFLARGELDKERLKDAASEVYFIPEGTPLHTQLLQFQRRKARVGLVVDEYGDIQGLVTLEDILEEIVGEFTNDQTSMDKDIRAQADGTYLVDGSANIRELNRIMHWELPTDGPKTLNGLIIEHLETIPEANTSVRIAGYPIEILQTTGNAIKTVRIQPALRKARHQ